MEGLIHQLLTTAQALPHESSSKEPVDMASMQGAMSQACRVTSAGVFRHSGIPAVKLQEFILKMGILDVFSNLESNTWKLIGAIISASKKG